MRLPNKKQPTAHPYDAAREALRKQGGGLFNAPMHTLLDANDQPISDRKWRGTPLSHDKGWAPWNIKRIGFPGKRYAHIRYIGTEIRVNVPDDTDEELQRLAQVYMDIINTIRVDE